MDDAREKEGRKEREGERGNGEKHFALAPKHNARRVEIAWENEEKRRSRHVSARAEVGVCFCARYRGRGARRSSRAPRQTARAKFVNSRWQRASGFAFIGRCSKRRDRASERACLFYSYRESRPRPSSEKLESQNPICFRGGGNPSRPSGD